MKRQIIALGGGGFSDDPENTLLDDYILAQSPKDHPKICFIPTASGDAEGYVQAFYNCYEEKECKPSHLGLFKGHTAQIKEFILEQDILFVGGGNTRNMLVLWKEWGLDQIIRQAYERGTILSGISAGSICWFEQGLTDSIPNQLTKLDCLGFLPGSNCPHFDGEPERQEVYRGMIESGEMKAGIACEDKVGLHYVDEELQNIISSIPEKKVFYFQLKEKFEESTINARYLDS